MNTVKIKQLNADSKIPTRAYEFDAGWDLYANEDALIEPQGRGVIKTGISMSIPNGYVGLIWPRSGLSVKQGADILAGVIDASYRGEVMVCLMNTDKTFSIKIKKGDRIAQILFQEVPQFNVEAADSLDDTVRGEGKFGSSGH